MSVEKTNNIGARKKRRKDYYYGYKNALMDIQEALAEINIPNDIKLVLHKIVENNRKEGIRLAKEKHDDKT